MKNLLSLFLTFFLLFSVPAHAQQQDVSEDIYLVYLKDGSVVQGVLFANIPGHPVSIQTSNGRFYTYNRNEIKRIVLLNPKKTIAAPANAYPYHEHRFEVEIGPSFAKGRGSTGVDYVGAHLAAGGWLTPNIVLGGGLDFDYGFSSFLDYKLVPIYVYSKVYLNRNKIRPFFSLDVGYALNGETDREEGDYDHIGGFLTVPAAGVSFRLAKRFALNCSVGYRMQWISEYALGISNNLNRKLSGSITFRVTAVIF